MFTPAKTAYKNTAGSRFTEIISFQILSEVVCTGIDPALRQTES